ncbi:MAG: hypothetical protein WCR49_12870 [Opitutae bacterium]
MNITTRSDSHETAQLEKLRTQLSTDIEALHLQEASLKEYEQRLRLLIDQSAALPANVPPVNQYFTNAGPTQSELDSAWEKYSRAHALLEAARRGLCDDRLAVKDREERVQLRETEISRREAWVKAREQELTARIEAMAQEKVVAKAKPSFTRAPFLAARNMLRRNG